MSKLDYLKKYTDGGDEGKKKRKKTKPSTAVTGGMKFVDAEVDVMKPQSTSSAKTTSMTSSLWDVGGRDDDEDDGPVVVEMSEETKKVVKGMWTSLDDVASSSSTATQLPRQSRQRHDSSDEDDLPRRRPTAVVTAPASTTASSSNARQRHDSSDEDVPRRRPPVAPSSSASHSQRTRHDSSDDDASPPRRTKPAESSLSNVGSESGLGIGAGTGGNDRGRARHDSSSDEDVPRRRPPVTNGSNDINTLRNSVVSAEEKSAREDTKRRKTASGHDAGLQSGSTFGKTEKELKAQRDLELSGADPSLLGAEAETVYRDRKGKKLDMLSEFMRQQAVKVGKEVKLQQAQIEWGRGSVQKDEEEAAKRELEAIAAEPFARTVENPRLEAMRKEAIRDGDPMAEYFMKKKEQDDVQQNKGGGGEGGSIVMKPRKPRYKGPVGLPNRFGIHPGYRWDGVDRGNQYEHKILTTANDRAALKEDEYKWSVADM